MVIYNCGGFVGKAQYIEKEFDKKLDFFYNRMNYEPEKSCFECVFFPVCMGGCNFETTQLKNNCQRAYLQATYDEYYLNYINV